MKASEARKIVEDLLEKDAEMHFLIILDEIKELAQNRKTQLTHRFFNYDLALRISRKLEAEEYRTDIHSISHEEDYNLIVSWE